MYPEREISRTHNYIVNQTVVKQFHKTDKYPTIAEKITNFNRFLAI